MWIRGTVGIKNQIEAKGGLTRPICSGKTGTAIP